LSDNRELPMEGSIIARFPQQMVASRDPLLSSTSLTFDAPPPLFMFSSRLSVLRLSVLRLSMLWLSMLWLPLRISRLIILNTVAFLF